MKAEEKRESIQLIPEYEVLVERFMRDAESQLRHWTEPRPCTFSEQKLRDELNKAEMVLQADKRLALVMRYVTERCNAEVQETLRDVLVCINVSCQSINTVDLFQSWRARLNEIVNQLAAADDKRKRMQEDLEHFDNLDETTV